MTTIGPTVELTSFERIRASPRHALLRAVARSEAAPDLHDARLIVITPSGRSEHPPLPGPARRNGFCGVGFSVPADAAAAAETAYALLIPGHGEVELPAPVERALAPPQPPSPGSAPATRRKLDLGGRTLRQQSARGTLINTAFMVLLSSISLLKGFILARFLSRADYGLWGILVVSFGTLLWLKQVGIGDKYLQQDDPDQEVAFQKAFTLEFMFTGAFALILALMIPVIALAYGQPKLLLPGFVAVLVMPALALQAPLWIFYREMNFVRQRTLQAIDPVVGFVVAIVLGWAGAGYWALALSILAGAWASAIAAIWNSPYRLRFRYEKATMRAYASFSWPLLAASGSSLVIAQSAIIAGKISFGVAGIGVVALASNISTYAQTVDQLVTGTMYPAICAVRERVDLLEESFVKSNRLALMWAVPFGAALGLFAGDLVNFGLGRQWRPAIVVLAAFGVTEAIGHLGFNWDAYMRATDRTRPVAIASALAMVAFLLAGVPLIVLFGLPGFAAATALQMIVHVACRGYFLERLFHEFSFIPHALRACLPSIPVVGLILLLRASGIEGHRTVLTAIAEVAVYAVATVAATWVFERSLLKEATSYVRARSGAVAVA